VIACRFAAREGLLLVLLSLLAVALVEPLVLPAAAVARLDLLTDLGSLCFTAAAAAASVVTADDTSSFF
jgi:hypothetical protein